jgi:hypothetical protein
MLLKFPPGRLTRSAPGKPRRIISSSFGWTMILPRATDEVRVFVRTATSAFRRPTKPGRTYHLADAIQSQVCRSDADEVGR